MNTNSGDEINVELLGPRTSANAEEAFDFVGSVLEFSTEYSLVATDLDGVILLWNEGARRLYGYEPAEVIGQPKSLLHTEEDVLRGLPQAMMDQALEQGKWEGRVERRRKDASNFIARMILTPRRDRDGKPVGFLLMSIDFTDEVRVSAELQRSQAYTRAVLESAPDAMVIVNNEGEIQLANAETEKLFGYGREELVGSQVEMLIPDRYRGWSSSIAPFGHAGVNYGLTTRSRRRYLQMARFRFSRCLSASRLHERLWFCDSLAVAVNA